MKKIIMLAPIVLAMVLVGCDDVQVSTGAGWGVDRISYHPGNWDYDYRTPMHIRQRRWRDYNDHNWGGRPGWSGHEGRRDHDSGSGGRRDGIGHDGGGHFGGGHNGGGFGGGHNGGNHGGGFGGGHHFLAEGLSPVVAESQAPALTRQDIVAYSRIGKAFGINTKAATTILEALNRAAVGDFGGLAGLGLNAKSLAAAKRNNGRLSASELDRLSRKLGVSQQKADGLIQEVLGH